MDCRPDNFQVDREIAVGQCIAHFICKSPWHLLMFCRELRMVKFNIPASLADNLEIPDHGILRLGILKKCHLRHAFNIGIDSLDRLLDVAQISQQALLSRVFRLVRFCST